MATGETATVAHGPFAGFSGTILREDRDQVVLALEMFGRITEIAIARDRLASARLDSLESAEREVLDAVARRGFQQRLAELLHSPRGPG